MSRELDFRQWVKPARQRAAANVVLVTAPLVMLVAIIGWKLAGSGWAFAFALAGAVVLAIAAARITGQMDRAWLIRRLDACDAGLEDSADLLFNDAVHGPIQKLQAERIAARAALLDAKDLSEDWWYRRIAFAWPFGLVVVAVIALWPEPQTAEPPLLPSAEGKFAEPRVPRLTDQRVRIVPPAYTGLPPRNANKLDVRAPVGSRIEWSLAFTPQPTSAALQLVGGQRLMLERGNDGWVGSLRLDRPWLYRVTAKGMQGTPPAHRLDPIADTPPRVRIVDPVQGLVIMRPHQRRWRLVFEASDDYAVAAAARLTLTIAQGEGEAITFSERNRMIIGSGPATKRRFAVDLDLASLGLGPGTDLVAQLTVADTRSPQPHIVRGPGAILRWPLPVAEQADGLDMMAKQVMPAYFRSQRQIIIDTEALIRQRNTLSAEEFLVQSDTIGVDQRLLRLRYGQFMGMEAEEQPRAPDLPIADDTPRSETKTEPEHYLNDGHDHGDEPDLPVFGSLGDVTAEFGHTHDDSEAATLLDPKTRDLLRRALDEMWQAELNLRSGKPDQALPFENRALEYIKQIQQSTRIYLPRIGSSQPPIDMTRRLTGKREGIVSRSASLGKFAIDDAVPANAWRSLAGRDAIDLDALDRWVRNNSARIRDPLAVLLAVDKLRNNPNLRSAREGLRSQLWTVLNRPPTEVRRREDGGAIGRRYLEGLR